MCRHFPEYPPGPRLGTEGGWTQNAATRVTRERNRSNHDRVCNGRTGSKSHEKSFLAGGHGVFPGKGCLSIMGRIQHVTMGQGSEGHIRDRNGKGNRIGYLLGSHRTDDHLGASGTRGRAGHLPVLNHARPCQTMLDHAESC